MARRSRSPSHRARVDVAGRVDRSIDKCNRQKPISGLRYYDHESSCNLARARTPCNFHPFSPFLALVARRIITSRVMTTWSPGHGTVCSHVYASRGGVWYPLHFPSSWPDRVTRQMKTPVETIAGGNSRLSLLKYPRKRVRVEFFVPE